MPVKKKTKNKEKLLPPPPEEGSLSLVLTVEETFSLIQMLTFSKEIFERMSANCKIDGDLKAAEVYAARSQLSLLLFKKLKIIAGIGEPTSREVH